MRVSTVLKNARRLLTNPKQWTKGVGARSKNGEPIPAGKKQAFAFCAVGAVAKHALTAKDWKTANLPSDYWAAIGFLKKAARGQPEPATYNDDPRRTHAQILNWFDRAIKLALKAELAK